MAYDVDPADSSRSGNYRHMVVSQFENKPLDAAKRSGNLLSMLSVKQDRGARMNSAEENAAAILKILATTEIGVQNAIVLERVLKLGIETWPLIAALIYAGEQKWIQNGSNGTLELTALGRAKSEQA